MNFPQMLVAVLFFAPTHVVLGQTLEINTPTSVVNCEPVQLAWSGGTPPYYLSLVPAGQTGAAPFTPQNGNAYTWLVDLDAGTSFTITLRDGEGIQAFSDRVTVLSGPETSCTNNQSSLANDETTGGPAPTAAVTDSDATAGSIPTTSGPPGQASPSESVKITSNGNAQPTVAHAQSSSPAMSKQRNASYKFKSIELQKMLSLFCLVFIALSL